jgi:hypothetical protein
MITTHNPDCDRCALKKCVPIEKFPQDLFLRVVRRKDTIQYCGANHDLFPKECNDCTTGKVNPDAKT